MTEDDRISGISHNESKLIDHILRLYPLHIGRERLRIVPQQGYSRVMKLFCPGSCYVIKFYQFSPSRVKEMSMVFKQLSTSKSAAIPIRNLDGMYFSHYDHELFAVFEKLDEITVLPDAKWWAKSLSDIHRVTIKSDRIFKKDCSIPTAEQWFLRASGFLDEAAYDILTELFDGSVASVYSGRTNYVFCHGDPQIRNVMRNSDGYVLIDLDNCGWIEKEYDIQRMMNEYLMETLNINFCTKFMKRFVEEYETLTNESIDFKILAHYFRADLIQTVSWLSIVCHQMQMPDRQRQQEEYDRYLRSLKSGIQMQFLRVLEERICD